MALPLSPTNAGRAWPCRRRRHPVAQVTDYVTKEDFAHLVAQINALTLSQGAPQGAVAQMAVPTPPTASPPPFIVGGQHCPEGYLFVGTHHHGVAIWGSVDTVTASMMENEAAGNDEVM